MLQVKKRPTAYVIPALEFTMLPKTGGEKKL
jgi:hypothetical protein